MILDGLVRCGVLEDDSFDCILNMALEKMEE